MSNLLDAHAVRLKNLILRHGRPVTLTDPEGTEHPGMMAIWNDVEHVVNLEGFGEEPMSEKSSLYFDRDTLSTLGIDPGQGWKATGAPSAYEEERTYSLEIPRKDRQLPGALFFLSKIPETDTGWNKVGE